MSFNYEELCETTQQQIAQLLEHEEHLEEANEQYAVTDIRTVQGKPIQLQDIQSDTLITVNGITGKVDDMIAAGIVSKSIYAGNFEDYLEDADAMFEIDEEHNDPEAYLINDVDMSNTISQLEDVLGSTVTSSMVSDVLAGNELDIQALEELSESYGVSPERAQKEIESLTDSLMDSFEDYLNEKHQGIDINHLTQWVAYVANRDTKIMQMYQQAVTGALGGDLNYSRDFISEYRKYYRLF
ncbi:hypothetical protein [Shewanella algicola]|uniref:hypothetical protein n=1 Tax=Shewanella algicola TaxID=640633 RepID=UPI0024945860|nr:hypothetical protein [Shewanella algicola]